MDSRWTFFLKSGTSLQYPAFIQPKTQALNPSLGHPPSLYSAERNSAAVIFTTITVSPNRDFSVRATRRKRPVCPSQSRQLGFAPLRRTHQYASAGPTRNQMTDVRIAAPTLWWDQSPRRFRIPTTVVIARRAGRRRRLFRSRFMASRNSFIGATSGLVVRS